MSWKNGYVRLLILAGVGIGIGASRAEGSFHLWKISQIYSNASGSVQFIQFQQPSSIFDDEQFVGGQLLRESANDRSFVFQTDLPSEPMPNQYFLVATPGYAALPGVPAPDYTLPFNNWFNPAGDTLTYASGLDSLTFTAGQLPTDGVHALFRAYGQSNLTTGTNLATNFDGASKTIAVPEPAMAGVVGVGIALRLLRRRSARR